MKRNVLYGWRYEGLWEKTKWFLTLTPLQRYQTMLSMQDLFFTANPTKRFKHDSRKSFKTVQVLGKIGDVKILKRLKRRKIK